jgi:hypothetical protein
METLNLLIQIQLNIIYFSAFCVLVVNEFIQIAE